MLRCTLLLLLLQLGARVESKSTNETAAALWYDKFDAELGKMKTASGEASWNNAVNITGENQKKISQVRVQYAAFVLQKATEINKNFDWQRFKNATLRRMFAKAVDIGTGQADAELQNKFSELGGRLGSIYSKGQVKSPVTGKMINLDPDVTRLLSDRSVPEKDKRKLWVDWRDATGRKMLPIYADFVSTMNKMIRQANHSNMAEYWQSYYEPKPGQNFEKMMAKLWDDVLPLYKEIHAYVRRRLRLKFGDGIFPPTGQIPAHILGNMWAQSWTHIEKDTTPFPDQSVADVTQEMRRQNWTVHRMVKESESFFTSIGLKKMTDLFWKKSVFERIPNVAMVCHASAWDFYTSKGDFRIKQCTTIDTPYLATTHHEMGHIQYYQQYEHQPVLFRRGGNPGFHEAIGDVLELSVLTPSHLKLIGLLGNFTDSKEYYLNYLYQMALSKLVFLPFGYLIDMWRWRVFDGSVQPLDYNDYWWQLRCKLQGVCSPVRRSQWDFDPGAKYHVPSNTPYIRYFVSHVLQFQLHKSLCDAANHTGPLYKCDIYKSKQAGKVMEKLMQPGSSRHWEEILHEATGTREVTADALKEYFNDLFVFLREENKRNGERVGWDDACPSSDWYAKSSGRLSGTKTWLVTWAAGLGLALVRLISG